MINAIVVDDEQSCIDRLSDLLATHCQHSVRLIGTASSVDDGVKAITNARPDVIFLDVQLDESTGFDLLKQLNEIRFEVIFTTAFEKYAVQAFKFSAIDYLLKPVDPDDLMQAVKKLEQELERRHVSEAGCSFP